ncbi:MAG: ElyC/SanA/YdcF family protein [Candidatus Pacebacteria bacterium]|nr:ElyC/SanA/YdcF family protein [Candidatus Paceibacterota bacterium]
MAKKRKKTFLRKVLLLVFFMALLTIILIFLLNLQTESKGLNYIFTDINKIPPCQAILILGASVYKNSIMSDMLKDRSDTAIELYKSSKAQKILVSGDNRAKNYNESATINKYLLEQGIPKEDIYLDYAGFDTYDSLYRAKDIFKVKSLIISTQKFHLPRAIFIARNLGIESYGIIADKRQYKNIEFNIGRELLATIKAYFDVYFDAKPTFLGEPIPIR